MRYIFFKQNCCDPVYRNTNLSIVKSSWLTVPFTEPLLYDSSTYSSFLKTEASVLCKRERAQNIRKVIKCQLSKLMQSRTDSKMLLSPSCSDSTNYTWEWRNLLISALYIHRRSLFRFSHFDLFPSVNTPKFFQWHTGSKWLQEEPSPFENNCVGICAVEKLDEQSYEASQIFYGRCSKA